MNNAQSRSIFGRREVSRAFLFPPLASIFYDKSHSEWGEQVKTVDNRFHEAKSAKAEENRAECTDATVFDQRRGQGTPPKIL